MSAHRVAEVGGSDPFPRGTERGGSSRRAAGVGTPDAGGARKRARLPGSPERLARRTGALPALAGAAALTSALVLLPAGATGQLALSGQVDLLALAGSDERGLNRNFRSDSPFSLVRLKLFGQHWVTERIGVFSELLFDVAANSPRVNGAYVVVNELAGGTWVNARVGLAPSPLGSFGLRSTYFNSNPLIGVPLLWQHRTTLDGSGLASNRDLVRRRESNVIGLPILYDACWNLQWELLGYSGPFEYSLAVTPGSTSNPTSSTDEDGVQVMARAGLEPTPGVRLGVSGAVGPYLGGITRDPLITARSYPGDPEDYHQRVGGVDLEVSRGRVRLFSEWFVTEWEAPLVSEALRAWSGYVEGRYDFLPAWHGALRVGHIGFSDISSTDDGTGPRTAWDDDVLRVEAALAYRLAREVMVRVGWQHTTFVTGGEDPVDLVGLQLRAVF